MIDLTLGHSPDPDDAFMWWPVAPVPESGVSPVIDTGRFRFTAVPSDIQDLNVRAAERGDLDITAVSMFAFWGLTDRYSLTACGASMGEGYGPKVLAREAHDPSWLLTPGLKIGVPGERTSAFLVLRLMLGQPFAFEAMRFDRIIPALLKKHIDAGLVIHEAQVTYQDDGLKLVADLGAWWKQQTGLPMPLGANVIRRDLDQRHGAGTSREVARILRASIEYALAHREQGLDYAMRFAGKTPRPLADRFIGLYVNDLTIDMGERGIRAVLEMRRRAADAGLMPDSGSPGARNAALEVVQG